MAREIELKIRLNDPEDLRNRLAGRASLEGEYHKVDTYFRGDQGSFRLREALGYSVVCRKEKTIEAGIEVSRETEFTVDQPQAFRDFVGGLGYDEWYRKEKRGRAWRWNGILIEVGTVSDLGWFAEFELLLDEESAASAVARARAQLLEALDDLGIDQASIEHKTYAELLGHRGR